MDKLNQRQLTLIKRAAEDAIHACNRHYGPFVDVVAHPLNIIALVGMAQSRQAEVDELSQENTRLKYLVGEKIGHPSARDLLDAEVQRQLEEQKQSENKEFLTDEDIENLIKGVLKDHDENPDKYWINIYKQVDDLQIAINEKDKRIKELEKKLLNLASMYSTKAAEFNIKDEQKLATVCNEISQILEKALRGEHED